MSTNNFHSKSGKYFVISATDDQEIDDTKDNIVATLETIDTITIEQISESEDELRSYPGEAFASLEMRNGRDDIYIECKVIARSGYYEGVNFDYQAMVYDGASGEYFTIEELDVNQVIESRKYWDGSRITATRAAATLRRLASDKVKIEAIVDSVLSQYTTQLNKIGQFSNGAAVYQEATR